MFQSFLTGFSLDDMDPKFADSAKGLQTFLKLIAWYSWGYIDYFQGLKVHLSVLQLHNVKKGRVKWGKRHFKSISHMEIKQNQGEKKIV